jgi:hypothetical protein
VLRSARSHVRCLRWQCAGVGARLHPYCYRPVLLFAPALRDWGWSQIGVNAPTPPSLRCQLTPSIRSI